MVCLRWAGVGEVLHDLLWRATWARQFDPHSHPHEQFSVNGQGPEKDLIQDYLLPRTHCNQNNKVLFLEASLSTWNGFY